jgi:DNA recombination protein RmuC
MFLGIVAIILIIITFIFLYLKIEELKKSEALRLLQEQLGQLRMEISQNLQNTSSQINLRLDKAAEVFSFVSEKIGGVQEATKRVMELSEDMKKLEDLLKPPKLRGEVGEILLQKILEEVLPTEHFAMQYSFKTGKRVDAVIKIGDKIVPIDSKFPLDSFYKLMAAKDEKERNTLKNDFIRNVKSHIDNIRKYILPEEGTFDFALMYIPAENVYYETILNYEIFDYSLKNKVIPVSPNTLHAYLMVILYGLRGLRIEEKAKEILAALGGIENLTSELRALFNTASRQLNQSKNNFDEVDRKLRELENRLSLIKK